MIDRRLNVLAAVARHRTVTAAAEVCNLTPSAVSHQIRALARELDLTLLEPAGRNIRLTPAAHTLLAHADVLAAQWERARADLAEVSASGVSGRLRFCGFSTAAAAFLPPAVTHLLADHPHLAVQVSEADPGRAFDLLASGAVDIAVVVATPSIPPATDAAFDQQPLYTEPLDVLVPPTHVLAARDVIALHETARDPWIVGTPGGTYHQLVMLACAAAGFVPQVAHLADEWDTGAALVAHGLGVALVPRLAKLPSHHRTRRIPLSGDPTPTRRILTAVRAGSRTQPAIAAGLRTLDRVAARHAAYELSMSSG